MLVALYTDPSANVDTLCDRFMQYGMRLNVADIREGKTSDASGSTMDLSSQSSSSSSSKGKGKARKRDFTDMTCYGCGKKGHLKRKRPDKSKGDEAKGRQEGR